MRTFLLAVTLAAGASCAGAETLTATCKEPAGYALGFRGELGKYARVDGPDSIQDGLVVISWKVSAPEANVVIRGNKGVSLHSGSAVTVFRSPEQVSFVATYPGAVFLYSVFPRSGTLMFSDHGLSLGFEPGSAINKSFEAKCEITVQ